MSLPPLQDQSQDLARLLSSHPPAKPGLPWNYAAVDSLIHRRKHTSTALSNGQLLRFGGFGLPNSTKAPGQNQMALLTHSKLSHPIILSISRGPSIQTVQLPIDPSTPLARLHHSSSLFVQDDQNSCVFFKLALAFGKDLGLEIWSDLPELVNLKLNGALVQWYLHQIAVWDEEHDTLIMSGGISENGVIATKHQYVL
jgi:hypothetical protein